MINIRKFFSNINLYLKSFIWLGILLFVNYFIVDWFFTLISQPQEKVFPIINDIFEERKEL